jgi:hypothetical protein
MPNRLTWTLPDSPSPIIGYALYRRVGSGGIDPEQHFLTFLAPTPLEYLDFDIDTLTLSSPGYTYAISALSSTGESSLSNFVLITFVFEEFAYTELWEFLVEGEEEFQWIENWDALPPVVSDPGDLEYEEGFEPPTISDPGNFEYEEGFEPPAVSDPGDLEYEEGFEPLAIVDPGDLEYEELWEPPVVSDPGNFEYEELWEVL